METIAKVYIKTIYGRTLCFPANDTAIRLTYLTGSKTLQKSHIRLIKELGFTVELVPDPDYASLISSEVEL